ncbi:MAG: hypothetical protein HC912_08635 [Saprospiraceae bacterium]|nr:hypothetical protein [Saprospiraceae bacterium]
MGGQFIDLRATTFTGTTENIDFTVNKSIQTNDFGINIERKLNRNLSVGVGVHYLNSAFILDYGMKIAYLTANEKEIAEGYLNTIQHSIPSLYTNIDAHMLIFRPKHSTLISNIDIPMSLSLHQNRLSLSVPIYMKIAQQKGRWTTYGKLGIAANFVQNKLKLKEYSALLPLNPTLDLEYRALELITNPSNANLTSRTEINYLIAMGGRYNVINKAYVFIEPTLQGVLHTTYANHLSDIRAKDQIAVGGFMGIGTFF